ncbi:MAG: hypothetical protein WC796_03120 [Candidatus Pacearchaeota archaeon]|jgi:hypothetical protein
MFSRILSGLIEIVGGKTKSSRKIQGVEGRVTRGEKKELIRLNGVFENAPEEIPTNDPRDYIEVTYHFEVKCKTSIPKCPVGGRENKYAHIGPSLQQFLKQRAGIYFIPKKVIPKSIGKPKRDEIGADDKPGISRTIYVKKDDLELAGKTLEELRAEISTGPVKIDVPYKTRWHGFAPDQQQKCCEYAEVYMIISVKGLS